jgi:hypothetical protein
LNPTVPLDTPSSIHREYLVAPNGTPFNNLTQEAVRTEVEKKKPALSSLFKVDPEHIERVLRDPRPL